MKEIIKNGAEKVNNAFLYVTSTVNHAVISDPERDLCIKNFINSVADLVVDQVKFEFNLYSKWQTITESDASLIKADIMLKLKESFSANTLYQDRLFELSKFEAGIDALTILKSSLVGTIQKREGFAAFNDNENDCGLSKYYFAQRATLPSTPLNLSKPSEDLSVSKIAFSYPAIENSAFIEAYMTNIIHDSILNKKKDYDELMKTQPQTPRYCDYYINTALQFVGSTIVGTTAWQIVQALQKFGSSMQQENPNIKNIILELVNDLTIVAAKSTVGEQATAITLAVNEARTAIEQETPDYVAIGNKLFDGVTLAFTNATLGIAPTSVLSYITDETTRRLYSPTPPSISSR